MEKAYKHTSRSLITLHTYSEQLHLSRLLGKSYETHVVSVAYDIFYERYLSRIFAMIYPPVVVLKILRACVTNGDFGSGLMCLGLSIAAWGHSYMGWALAVPAYRDL